MLPLRGHGFCFTHHVLMLKTEKRKGNPRREVGKGEGVLGTLAWCCPPLSVTVPEHCSAHHSGLHLQLLHFLQQRFLAGVLGPVSKEKTRRT